MTLKQKTVSGLVWSFADNTVNLFIQFAVGIVLARLLSPAEFGLIGMLTIFIAVSQSFINSGFSQALIRKTDPSRTDYSTVFYFNMVIGVLCFLILFFCAGLISRFFREPQLKPLVRVLGLSLIINAFSIIQQTILTRRINFKLQAKISVISSVISGAAAIIMALLGFGVWSLVAKTLIMYAVSSFLLWLWNNWKPVLAFSVQSFRELFRFGSNLLISGLIDTLYRNVYYLIIGRFFSAQELGYYSRADQFQALPSSNLTTVIQRVSYPVLSTLKGDIPQLKDVYKKLIRSTMLICFVLMLGMAAVARPMILALIGDKWEPCVVYLQLLCFAGMFYPLHALNLNILEVKGRSDLFLRLEIIKKTLAVPILFFGIIWGIKVMIMGMIAMSLFAYFLNSYWSGHLIGYSFSEQVKDILPSFLLASGVSAVVFSEALILSLQPLPLLAIQLLTGAALTLGICEAIEFRDYVYIRETIKEKVYKTLSFNGKAE
ncbi:MAG TPA: lipopolysaccharide biosynthesis protein [Bacteroidales bacterium]|nr:lipopolysaccharide biosynthesis protein [Bacteroidales bacterium]